MISEENEIQTINMQSEIKTTNVHRSVTYFLKKKAPQTPFKNCETDTHRVSKAIAFQIVGACEEKARDPTSDCTGKHCNSLASDDRRFLNGS
jgi:hypothetical protein